MTGLYIHIPFCISKCHYCNFIITTSTAPENHTLFLKALEKEMKHYEHDFSRTVFDTLYLGGGTPSVMSAEEMQGLFKFLRKNFKFKRNAEVTCEVNPGDIRNENAQKYRKLGVNRISLGAQSFRDDTLKRLNRRHSAKDISDSFKILRENGFKNISLDLILSLPGETLADVKYSLNELFKLDPEHVSLYELTIEKNTVFGSLFKRGKLDLPDEDLQLQMLSMARETLQKQGFDHYELLSYAKPDFESSHNLIYWANEKYLGLGPGAFSYFGGKRFRNSSSVEEYLRKIKCDDWTAFEEEHLSPEKKEIESFLLALRLKKGANAQYFRSLAQKFQTEFARLEEQGLIEKKDGFIRLTGRGQLFAETVFSELSGV